MALLATKKTGNYTVKLRYDARNETYALGILYTGEWSGAHAVDVYLRIDPEDRPSDTKLRKWFRDTLRGDLDAEGLLLDAGYDRYGNPGSRQRDVRISL